MECKLLIYLKLLSFTEHTDFLILTPFLSVKPLTIISEKEKKITHHDICWTSCRIAFFCPSLFSKSWKRSVKPSGPSWMEDMTTSSASWHHVWDWRNLIWRTPYWKEIRQYILGFFAENYFMSRLNESWISSEKIAASEMNVYLILRYFCLV